MGTIERWIDDNEETHRFITFDIVGRDPSLRGIDRSHSTAVYIFAKQQVHPALRPWKALYIGETEDLTDRLQQHQNKPNDKLNPALELGMTHVHVLYINEQWSEDARTELEASLIRQHQPPLNVRHK